MVEDPIVASVLLVPSPDMIDRLIRIGPLKQRPPIVVSSLNLRFYRETWRTVGSIRGENPRALALLWEGELQADGVFAAWYQADDVGTSALESILYEDWVTPRNLANMVAGWGLGDVVCLGPDGFKIGPDGIKTLVSIGTYEGQESKVSRETAAMLHVLDELDGETLQNCYGINIDRPDDAPLDQALAKWKAAGGVRGG